MWWHREIIESFNLGSRAEKTTFEGQTELDLHAILVFWAFGARAHLRLIPIVSLVWREKWSRLSRLSWNEVHTRVRQELGKRVDASLPRSAFRFKSVAVETARRGKFFFSPPELPERVSLLREHLPAEVEAILGEADEICGHRFRLLGYVDLHYGPEIDWHLDAVNGKRSPLKPWHKINFFNFAEIGDHKVTWELNRHQHLVALTKAYLLTRDSRYSKELISQWYSWQRANPYPIGINWASSLEVAFRSFSWIWVQQLLAGSPDLSRQFDADLVRGLALNGRYIERYLSTYFSPNTHLLGEAAALFFIGVLYPEIPSADRWKKKGLEVLLQQAERQVYPDGLYFEQSLYYHVYAVDLFLHVRLLAWRNEIDVPASFDDVIKKMLDVIKTLSQTGAPPGFGDDDGGRLFSPRRNRCEYMTDPLAVGATIFKDGDLRGTATLTEESIWLCGELAVQCFSRQALPVAVRSKSFPAGGLFVSAESGRVPQQIVIDAGPLGAMRAGHGHADALSVKYSSGGSHGLVDSGTFRYISRGNERNLFRGTGAHNTLRVDEVDQALPDGPFSWKHLPTVRADSWIMGETFTYFSGSHSGYLRLSDPVSHLRYVFHLFAAFWMVRDVVQGKTEHVVETFWHIDPSLAPHQAGSGFIAASEDSGDGIAFVPVSDDRWECGINSAQISRVYGVAEPAPVLRCRSKIQLPAEHAMAVQALTAKGGAPGELVRIETISVAAKANTAYEYRENGRTHLMVFRDPGAKEWKFGDWQSDAEFLYCRAEGQRISQFAACDSSFVRHQGEDLLAASRRVERFEYWEQDGKARASSSDAEVLRGFSDTRLQSRDAGVTR